MKLLHVHAHFDDFEFVSAGLFEMQRRALEGDLQARVLVCTDGKAGHHFRTRDETMEMRLAEQRTSAAIGDYEFHLLRYPSGLVPREACLQLSIPLLAALWKEIRDFEPDYLFCPPYPSDPLAGVHIDHLTVAEAIRKVAYMVNVPHAFTPEFPANEVEVKACRTPVILNVYDGYMTGANGFDLAVDVDDAFSEISRMTWCHQSQISEWLPWIDRHELPTPRSFEEWSEILRTKFLRRNRELGVVSDRVHEFFTVTAWGTLPTVESLLADFRQISRAHSRLEALEQRLRRWRGERDA